MILQAAAADEGARSATPWLLLGIGVLLLAISITLFLVLRRGAKTVEEDDPSAGAEETLLFPAGPRRAFAAGVAALRSYLPGRDARYEVPWVAILGAEGSGTSTVADGIGLPRPFAAEAADDGARTVRWSFFDQGVLLDLPGPWIQRRNGTPADMAGWRTFLRLLRWHRPGRPLDAVVLTLPADQLAGPDAPGKQALLARAGIVRERLAEAQRRLGVRFPVHVLVTQCDRVAGFAATCHALPDAARDEVFGWSSPYPLGARFSAAWVDEAYDTVGAGLYETQVELLAGAAPAEADGLFRFPAELRRTLPSLRGFLDEVFRESVYQESFFFRGIYFTGDPGAPGASAADLAPPAPADPHPSAGPPGAGPLPDAYADPYGEADEPVPAADAARPAAPVFLRQLFAERIFAEAGLARPVGSSLLDGGRGARAAQVAAAALLILGIPALLLAGNRLRSTAGETLAMLEQSHIILAQLERESEATPGALPAGNTSVPAVVEGLAGLRVSRLWSPVVPASWSAGVRGRVRAAQVAALRDAVYPALLARLLHNAQALTGPSVPGPGGGAGHPSTATPAVLADYLHELGALSQNVNRYNRLVSHKAGGPDDLENLIAYLYHQPPPDPSRARRRAYVWAIAHATGTPVSRDMTEGALQRARELAGDVYARLGATVEYLEQAESGTLPVPQPEPERYDGAAWERTGGGAEDGLASLPQGTAGRAPFVFAAQGGGGPGGADASGGGPGGADADNGGTEASGPAPAPFAAGELSGYFAGMDSLWLVQGPAEALPPAVQAALDSLVGSGVLNANTFRREFPQQFAEERALRLDGMGGLPGAAQPGDPARARAMVALRDALATVNAQPFARGGMRVSLANVLPPGAAVAWDTTLLGRALTRYDEYLRFVGAPAVTGMPPRSRNLVRTLAAAQLEARMTLDVSHAARAGGSGAALLSGSRDRQLRARVAGLKPAAPQLARILDAYRALGLAPSYDDLATVVAADGQAVLQGAEQLLEDRGLYRPRDGGFDWWNGAAPVSFAAFGVSDTAGLDAWLAEQRTMVEQVYTLYAEPVLALLDAAPMEEFAADPPPAAAGAMEAAERWTAIRDALAAYTARKPGSLSSLEALVSDGMAGIGPGDCGGASSRGGGGSDWFAQRREQLRAPLWARCRTLSARAAAAGYNRLRGAFTEDLAGRFPFADADARDEADPAAVTAFLRLYAESGIVRRSVASGSDGVGGPGSAAASFLARMDAVAAFLTPLVAADTAGGPVYRTAAEFRVAREREAGADQVAEWGMRIGQASLTPRDSAGASLPWSPGAPVWVTFRWAEGSPVRPAPADLPHGARASGPLLTYGAGGNWALLRMLRARGVSGAPQTLAFGATTVATPPAVPRSTPGQGIPGPALLLVRVRLYDPVSGRERVLPPFPTEAPGAGGDP